MKNRNKLASIISEEIKQHIANAEWINTRVDVLNKQRNIPIKITSDVLTMRTDLRDASDFVLYCIASITVKNIDLTEYFTAIEINAYKNEKYTVKQVSFPYAFENMIEIRPDSQWIGKITAKELMMLRDAQLINYNENAQRTLKHIIGDTFEYHQIDLNRKAVNEIMDLYRENVYIPNTITLNLSDDANYYYNESKRSLIIKDRISFDILDGYHRYISMSNMTNLDHEFDYEMELRIVNFSEEVARQFIHQEDQKTKMAKIDSDALSSQNNGNKVVHMIENKMMNIIARNKGIIDETVLSQLFNTVVLKNKKYDRAELNQIRDKFTGEITDIQDYYPRLLSERWSLEFTTSFMVLLYGYNLSSKNLYNEACKLADKLKKNKNILSGRIITKAIITRTKKLYEEG